MFRNGGCRTARVRGEVKIPELFIWKAAMIVVSLPYDELRDGFRLQTQQHVFPSKCVRFVLSLLCGA